MPTLRKVRHSLAKTPARLPLIWARHRSFRESDAFVGSYPRSGSTWLRFMLTEILAGQSSGFSNVNQTIPDVGKHDVAVPILSAHGRLIKTHEPYRAEYKKAIYLVRDARDVALSEFAYQNALGLASDDFDKYLPHFLRGEVNPFGSWIDHVNTWMNAADSGRAEILLVRFEELRSRSEEQLARIVEFLGVPVQRQKIREAVTNNSLKRMRDKEKAEPQRASAGGRFIRSGSAGGWREKFTENQIQLVRKYAARAMARIGYPAAESLEKEPA